jgi:hypothetical protein
MDRAAAAWADPDAFPLTLLILGLDRFADPRKPAEPLQWLPATWRDEGADEFRVDPDDRAFGRLCAALTALQTPDEWFGSEQSFLDLARALVGFGWAGAAAHPPTTEELAWAVVEAALLGLSPAAHAYSPGITRLVNMTAREDGYAALPDVFKEYGVRPDKAVWAAGPRTAPGGEDDPAMVAAYETARTAKEGDLDAFVRDQVGALAAQLKALPLTRLKRQAAAVAAGLEQIAQSR